MKCGNVQEILEEYLEGALEPADEMCVDIHLIQCEHCRAEIHGLHRLLGAIAGEIRHSRHGGHELQFLNRFHAVRASELQAAPREFPPRRLVFARAIAVAVTAALIISSGLFGGSDKFASAKPAALERAGDVTMAEWKPYLRHTGNLIDLSAMGLVDTAPRAAD